MISLGARSLNLRELRAIAREAEPVALDGASLQKVKAGLATVELGAGG